MLEFIILGFLCERPMHGYDLKMAITQLAGYYRPVSDGALYPAIARLERSGMLVKREAAGLGAAHRLVLSLTPAGEAALLDQLRCPADIDISNRNHFFTILAFLKFLPPEAQCEVLRRRLAFLEGGRSFFQTGGKPVRLAEEDDPFRKGMLHIARETSRVEKDWLLETIAALERPVLP
jgi:DNA-binding PadR family transcriptional regulator